MEYAENNPEQQLKYVFAASANGTEKLLDETFVHSRGCEVPFRCILSGCKDFWAFLASLRGPYLGSSYTY